MDYFRPVVVHLESRMFVGRTDTIKEGFCLIVSFSSWPFRPSRRKLVGSIYSPGHPLVGCMSVKSRTTNSRIPPFWIASQHPPPGLKRDRCSARLVPFCSKAIPHFFDATIKSIRPLDIHSEVRKMSPRMW